MQKEVKRKHEAVERKRRCEEKADRLRKLEEQRVLMEEKEREQMRREVEKMEEMEREKKRQAGEQQRRLAEAMRRDEEEWERELQQETKQLSREEYERQKKLYRRAVEKETEAMLKNENRWYYEGGNVDWQEDRRRSAGKITDRDLGLQTARSECKVPSLSTSDQQEGTYDAEVSLRPERSLISCRETPQSPRRVKSQKTFPGTKRPKRRPKSPAKKPTSKPEAEVTTAADEPGSGSHIVAEVEKNMGAGNDDKGC